MPQLFLAISRRNCFRVCLIRSLGCGSEEWLRIPGSVLGKIGITYWLHNLLLSCTLSEVQYFSICKNEGNNIYEAIIILVCFVPLPTPFLINGPAPLVQGGHLSQAGPEVVPLSQQSGGPCLEFKLRVRTHGGGSYFR